MGGLRKAAVWAMGLAALLAPGCDEGPPTPGEGAGGFFVQSPYDMVVTFEPTDLGFFNLRDNVVLAGLCPDPLAQVEGEPGDGWIRAARRGHSFNPATGTVTISVVFEQRKKGFPVGQMFTLEVARWELKPAPNSFYVLLPGGGAQGLPLPAGLAAKYKAAFGRRGEVPRGTSLVEALVRQYEGDVPDHATEARQALAALESVPEAVRE